MFAEGVGPLEAWPFQDEADWIVRLRQVAPHAPFPHVHMMARLMMTFDRRIGTEEERDTDRTDRLYEIANWMATAVKAERARQGDRR